MGRYRYKARDPRGNLQQGLVSAASTAEAGSILRGENKFIVQITAVNDADLDVEPITLAQRAKRVKRSEVIGFTHQLSVMLQTGVPMSEALHCLVEQCRNEHFAAILKDIRETVESGGELSAALRKFPKVFPPVMTGLVRASEVSGTMSTMLERIADYMTKDYQTVRSARGAMMYPLFMLAMTIVVTIFLLIFVLPRFAAIYESRQAGLPLPTYLLVSLSNGLMERWYFAIGATAALVFAVIWGGRTRFGRAVIDWLKLNTPVIGNLFSKLYLSRAFRTLGTMFDAGVPMLDAIGIVKHVNRNTYYDVLWSQVDEKLKHGSQLSDPLMSSPLIPRSLAQMVLSGEKSGQLGRVLNRIAGVVEIEFDEAIKTSTQFIEPVMVLIMGSIIGFVAIAMLMPIFSVGHVMSGG